MRRCILPPEASFYALYDKRFEAGNGERIDKALHAIEEANIHKLQDVFQDISFNSTRLGDEAQKNDILRHLLEDFAKPALDLSPSRVGKLDIIGNAYEFLIKNFAATGGKKAGEFYTPPEVSELIAELVEPKEETGTLKVTLKPDFNDGSFLAEAVVKSGLKLSMLREEEIDLEDVFMGITKGITN